jgi:hypothetical protein
VELQKERLNKIIKIVEGSNLPLSPDASMPYSKNWFILNVKTVAENATTQEEIDEAVEGLGHLLFELRIK